MNPSNSPGPDGFTALLFQKFWMIVEEDFIKAIQWCYHKRKVPSNINSNFLTLISKTKNAAHPNQFRPICLSIVVFKIIKKLLPND